MYWTEDRAHYLECVQPGVQVPTCAPPQKLRYITDPHIYDVEVGLAVKGYPYLQGVQGQPGQHKNLCQKTNNKIKSGYVLRKLWKILIPVTEATFEEQADIMCLSFKRISNFILELD